MPPPYIKPSNPAAASVNVAVSRLLLPNARVGQAYCVDLFSCIAEVKQALQLQQPSELGLQLDVDTGQLLGTPMQPGDFSLQLTYLSRTHAQPQTCRLNLLVVQDPKNLWKNIPSNPQGLFARPDAEAEQQASAAGRLLAASKRGRSHAHVGSYRDDAYAVKALSSGWNLLIAADGAGSAAYSRRGAELICTSASAYLSEQLQGSLAAALDASVQAFAADPSTQPKLQLQLCALLGQAAYAAVKNIYAQRAEVPGAQVKDFSSTALIALYRQFSFGTLCACYWVGDGAAAVYRQGREVVLLGAADAGEFAGQTRFLDESAVTIEAIQARTRFVLVEELTAFVLMTDGVSDPKFDTEACLHSLPPWDALWRELDPLVRQAQPHERLLEWLDFWSPGNHDDRTIVLALPEQAIPR
ncbi:MAG TPA: PP2C family serine/threonine-protein phosphatase [Cellvibrionaceae bacterium]